MAWAISLNNANNRIIQPWAGYFRALGADTKFQQIQIRGARSLMNCAVQYTQRFNLPTERALAFFFDVVSQSGTGWLNVSDRQRLINEGIARMKQAAGPPSPLQVLMVIANVVADTSTRFREDVRSRKLAIGCRPSPEHQRGSEVRNQRSNARWPNRFDTRAARGLLDHARRPSIRRL